MSGRPGSARLFRMASGAGRTAQRRAGPDLRRYLERTPTTRAGERCEMCGTPIAEPHAHVVNLESRGLLCTCRPCYLLFAPEGAGQGRFVAVPDRVEVDPDFVLAQGTWESMGIPVRMAFFFTNSVQGKVVAFYPSPAGATESLLPLDAWDVIVADNRYVGDLLPDVEALLVDRGNDGTTAYVVPIDLCYELVGIVRSSWRGFDGGEEAWRAIGDFFARLQERGRRVAR